VLAERGIVDVDTRFGAGRGAGTGLVLSGAGVVLTNNHVIRGATSIRVVVPSTGRSYAARVVGYDLAADVAVLRLPGAVDLGTVRLGGSRRATVGESVTSIGNAGGQGGSPKVTSGTILALHQRVDVDEIGLAAEHLTDMVVTDTALAPGDSGGALLDAAGEVIGMNTAGSIEPGGGPGFAIPIANALAIVGRIDAGRASDAVHVGPTPFLGIAASATASSTTHGVRVDRVVAASPAGHAGLRSGDVITAVDGRTVASSAALTLSLGAFSPGRSVELAWRDGSGAAHTARVRLASGPPQ
jgi:S1-C subfamily serine protease